MLLKTLKTPLEWTELPDREPGPTEIRVRVLACGVCRTRQDGLDFLKLAPQIEIKVKTTPYPLREANQALSDLRAGRFEGAAVLMP